MKTIINNKINAIILMLIAMLTQINDASAVSDSNGVWTVTPHGRGIKISFKPDSTKVNCADIRLVQTVKMTFLDDAGNATVVNPADISPNFKHLGDDTLADGTVVDHLWCEKDASYNGNDNPQDKASQGSSSPGNSSVPTAMKDYPYIGDGRFPAGKTKVLMEFEVCAICMNAPYASYGCIKWKYERTKGSGNNGSSTLISGAPSAQSPGHSAAHTKFKTNHTSATNTAICPEEVALANTFSKLYDLWGPFWFKANQPYEVIHAGSRVRKGIDPPTVALPTTPIGNIVMPFDFVFVPAGDRLCLRRTGIIPSTDPQIPFPASFFDVFYGSGEAVETGVANGTQHTGIRVKNCSGTTLCAAAPLNSTNPAGHVMFSARINHITNQVIIKNNALSTHGLNAIDILHGLLPTTLNPGDSAVYSFPGQMPACASKINLKLFIQGYMNGANQMNHVLFNAGQEADIDVCDSIDIELRSPMPPYPIVASTRTLLHQDGNASCNFPMLNGAYYIVVRHRNTIETWSATPVFINQNEIFYNFSDAAFKAYGGNQVLVGNGVWALFNGDVNQDLSIDLLDAPILEAMINNFASGYYPEDVNGDGSIDLLDYSELELNINNFVYSHQPN